MVLVDYIGIFLHFRILLTDDWGVVFVFVIYHASRVGVLSNNV